MGRKPLLFGEYLYRKGLIGENDVLVARHVQMQANKQIGELALKQKMLNAQKVQQIFEQQKRSRKRLGEVTINLNVLTRTQVKDFLKFKEDFNIRMHDLFIFEGKLKGEQVEYEIQQFAEYHESRLSINSDAASSA